MKHAVPEGLLVLDLEGLVVEYLPARAKKCPSPGEIVGGSLFSGVFESAEFQPLREAFQAIAHGEDAGSYRSLRLSLKRGTRLSRYVAGLIPSPLPGRLLLNIATLAHPDLPMTTRLRADSVRGSLSDAAGLRVLMANVDLWKALDEALGDTKEARDQRRLIGKRWGKAHAERVESFVQRKTMRTLRELELETALEYLSGSLAVIGLGRFETNLEQRHEGLIIVDHHNSPFPEMLSERAGCCELLEGFYSGVFSYLSGRELEAMELCCVSDGAPSCRFLLGTMQRIEGLMRRASTSDTRLLKELEEGCR